VTAWWHYVITFGDVILLSAALVVLCLLIGAVILLGHWAREIAGGFRDGWNKSGKPFWAEVAERAAKKRSGSG